MSQVQSTSFSAACDWNFAVDGDPGVAAQPTGLDLGLTINPGILIEASYYNILAPLVTTGNPAVDTLTIYFIGPSIFTNVFSDTIDNINLKFLNDWYFTSRGPYVADQPINQNFAPINFPGNYQIKCSSSAPMTAGRILVNFSCVGLNIH